MKANAEGFLMPAVDSDKCVDCGRCDKVCPHLNTKGDIYNYSLRDFEGTKAYLYYSLDERRIDSASGGFLLDINRKTIEEGGCVCGCIWNDELKAVHIMTDKQEEMERMQSSKYVQSDMDGCFRQVRDRLKEGRKVTFCGTPCQTAGLRKFLGRLAESEDFVSVCLICHGVPSPAVWEYYKRAMEKKYKGKMISVNMRDKRAKGYSLSHVRYKILSTSSTDISGQNRSEMSVLRPTFLSDPYIYLFTSNLFLRNSCFKCAYKSINTGADIIVGDFYASTEGAGDLGCSCLVALTDKGDRAINSQGGVIKDSTIEDVGSVNGMICHSVPLNPKRESFFRDFAKSGEYDLGLFRKYLPLRFYVKDVLGRLGIFNTIRKVLKG